MTGGGLAGGEVHAIVRHLLTGCPYCIEETSRLWNLAREKPHVLEEAPIPDLEEAREDR